MNVSGRVVEPLPVLLARQENIVDRRQLLRGGIDDCAISRRIRRGDWQRIVPGVYALGTAVLSTEQRRIAAALYCGDEAQLTGATVLHWYGFRYVPSTDKVHVLVPHSRRRRSAGIIVVQRALELDTQPRDAGLYRLVSPARAVVDAARLTSDLTTVRAIFTEAVQGRFTDPNTIAAELRRAKRSRTAVANRVLSELFDGVRSAPEAELRQLVRTSRILATFVWNPVLVADDGTRLPSPDGYQADSGIALEVDSLEYHMTSEGFEATMRRGNLLSRYGVTVLHFTPTEIRTEPARVLRVIEDTYQQNRLNPPRAPITVVQCR
jgi:hypothetical protein